MEQLFTATIVSVMDDGLTANVALDRPFKNRIYAVIDDRTAGRKRLRDRMGGRLIQGETFPIKEQELREVASVTVITAVN